MEEGIGFYYLQPPKRRAQEILFKDDERILEMGRTEDGFTRAIFTSAMVDRLYLDRGKRDSKDY